jgi:hypothetical protein
VRGLREGGAGALLRATYYIVITATELLTAAADDVTRCSRCCYCSRSSTPGAAGAPHEPQIGSFDNSSE